MMTDYTKLVEALRSASTVSTAWEKLMHDAAAAIEALQAQLPKRGEIVRCKECKWSRSCGYISTRSYAEWKDWYCADGAKMEVQE